MSIETRLRDAKPGEDASWEAAASTSYQAVLAARSRQRARRLTVTGSVAVAAALVVAVTVGAQRSGSDPSPAPAAPTAVSLEGSWHTGWQTRGTVARALMMSGVLASQADRFGATLPDGRFRIRLRATDGVVRARIAGQQSDVEHLTTQGTTVVLRPSSGDGSSTYRVHQSGDRISLELLRTSVDTAHDGFPARIHYLATYTTARFEPDE